jgi:YegS/Rv2252/BmrU family lipid kinase
VAIGCDGLVGSVAGAMRGAPGALAIVPAGRGNDLARVLGIPREPRAAARLAVEGEQRLLDVAEANGKPFVGIASLGFDSEANRIANESRLSLGSLVYLYAALRALAGWRDARFEVTVDGERHSVTGYSVAVANSKAYGGGMLLAPHAKLDDGRLDVMMVSSKSKLSFLRGVVDSFKGRHVDDPAVRFLRGAEVAVDADRPFTVYADGDPIAELPVRIEIVAVVRVLVPPRAATGADVAGAGAGAART